ncbi:MAG: glutaredoxin domain-containing protein [bacterium]|nr:glutaredoxin domain-containing protein [bacterium]
MQSRVPFTGHFLFLVFSISFCFLAVFEAYAESKVYFYTDGSGQKHFYSDLKSVPEKYRSQVQDEDALPELTKTNDVQVVAGKMTQAGKPQRRFNKSVSIYVTASCPHCRNLEKFLKENSIPFRKYDVETSAVGGREYEKLGGGGVPIIKVGKKVIRGFNQVALQDELGL